MHIAIIGTGGVGGYFGGLLAKAGYHVTFVARGEQFNALRENGLTVKSVDAQFFIPEVRVVDSVRKLGPQNLILVATKAYDIQEVATDLVCCDSANTIIICVQNGIYNDAIFRKHLTQAQVYPGLAYIISARTSPGVIEQTAGPRTLIFGDRSCQSNSQLLEIESLMRKSGILATASSDILRDLWTKFIWITTFAGMTSLCRCSIGELVSDPEAFSLYLACLAESIAVATADGVEFSDEDRAKIVAKSEDYRKNGSHAKSSMLVDIENKRRTEIEVLNGTIVTLGRKYGIPTPIHDTIYTAVRLAEGHYLN